MRSGFMRAVSIVGTLRTMTIRQGLTPVIAAVATVGSICMFGCMPQVSALSSGYSEIAPGTVPVDTFMVDDTYKAVKIGGVTWMAENLNIKNGNSWCLNDNPAACAALGRLYDWKTAKNICPPGWHLPSRQEWADLEAMAGGSKAAAKRLKSKKWGGTDDYGFSALPGGVREVRREGTTYYGCTDNALSNCSGGWWTSDSEVDFCSEAGRKPPCDEANRVGIAGNYFGVGGAYSKKSGLSVRCILND